MKKELSLLLILVLCLSFVTPGITQAATIKLNKSMLELRVGDTFNLKLSGASGSINWTSSKKSVATISSSGNVKAIKKGTVTIKASFNKKDYKCKVTVLSNKTTDIIYGVYTIDGSSIEEYAKKYKTDNPDCLDVKVYDDEHIAVTMYETDRIKAIKEFNKNSNEYALSLIADNNVKDIFTDVNVDKLYQNIKIFANKEAYEASPIASFFAGFAFGVVSDMVQAINLIDPGDRVYNITIVDNKTGKVLNIED